MLRIAFSAWRRIHIGASTILALIAIIHTAVTFVLYEEWTPDAVWFLGTGVGLLFLAAINRAHIGVEPCPMPTALVVRWANVAFGMFGLAAVIAVPEPQAYGVLAALIIQAIAGFVTLVGPARNAADHT